MYYYDARDIGRRKKRKTGECGSQARMKNSEGQRTGEKVEQRWTKDRRVCRTAEDGRREKNRDTEKAT